MSTIEDRRDYVSFLVRLRRTTSAGRPIWRVSIEDPRTGKQRSFADLASLFRFLEERTQPETLDPLFPNAKASLE